MRSSNWLVDLSFRRQHEKPACQPQLSASGAEGPSALHVCRLSISSRGKPDPAVTTWCCLWLVVDTPTSDNVCCNMLNDALQTVCSAAAASLEASQFVTRKWRAPQSRSVKCDVQMVEEACHQLRAARPSLVGLDMEWRVKFQTGVAPCDVAVIQLCYELPWPPAPCIGSSSAGIARCNEQAHSASVMNGVQQAGQCETAAHPQAVRACAVTARDRLPPQAPWQQQQQQQQRERSDCAAPVSASESICSAQQPAVQTSRNCGTVTAQARSEIHLATGYCQTQSVQQPGHLMKQVPNPSHGQPVSAPAVPLCAVQAAQRYIPGTHVSAQACAASARVSLMGHSTAHVHQLDRNLCGQEPMSSPQPKRHCRQHLAPLDNAARHLPTASRQDGDMQGKPGPTQARLPRCRCLLIHLKRTGTFSLRVLHQYVASSLHWRVH